MIQCIYEVSIQHVLTCLNTFIFFRFKFYNIQAASNGANVRSCAFLLLEKTGLFCGTNGFIVTKIYVDVREVMVHVTPYMDFKNGKCAN